MVMFMNSTKAADYKCPSCKAPLLFDPKLGKWKCNYCESVFSLEELEMSLAVTSTNADKVKARRIIERIKQLTITIELISKNRRS